MRSLVKRCHVSLVGLLGQEEYPQSRSVSSRKSMMYFQSDSLRSVTVASIRGNPTLRIQFRLSSMQALSSSQFLGFSAKGLSLAEKSNLFLTLSSIGDSAMSLKSPLVPPVMTTKIFGFMSKISLPAQVAALFQSVIGFPSPHVGSQLRVLLIVCLICIANTLGLCMYLMVRAFRHSIHLASRYFSLHHSPSDSVNSLKQLALLQAFRSMTSSPALVSPFTVISRTSSAFLPFIHSLAVRQPSSIFGFSKQRSRLKGMITVLKPYYLMCSATSSRLWCSRAETQALVEWQPLRLQEQILILLPKESTILAPSVLIGKAILQTWVMAGLSLKRARQGMEAMAMRRCLSLALSFLQASAQQFPIRVLNQSGQ